ncbi:HET-domain-containing protein, partial [Lentinus tigrinus ALCF2SS1-6]
MRLLDTRTGDFVWVNDPSTLRFSILSHVWSPDGEQSYQDLLRLQDDVRTERALNPELPMDTVLQRASPKIRDSCAFALANGFDLLWLDSCCIDKTSSAELSEAINSMYTWYSLSTVCYAFLHDVDTDEDPRRPHSTFRRSCWHTRGWTLQELIAPLVVVFISSTWNSLGTKTELAGVIEEVTGVDQEVLNHTISLSSVTVARRMSWAARRVTTRKEDEAYSLMGIFGVNMPAIYGEGALAFGRLQEEILKQVPDQTIFVW